ncbi:MAG: hypothetical protein ACMG51_00510 [Ginsengibacter sp.]
METLAIRRYHDVYPITREEFELQDRLVRKADGSFAKFVAGLLPGDSEIEVPVTLMGLIEWYQDCPEQIEQVTRFSCGVACNADGFAMEGSFIQIGQEALRDIGGCRI